ncbi:nuclear pore complex associated protein [Schizosaccharomyces japonicus yFS275]|uniref:Nuclear pore complex associated protein n=1 Tax=Schizosaccharomyces japonicus (strain yFS275 / FY16936) TaxID=402676 RepID=B6JZW1_SCHJY|nr:nuclear pore complex associated protein [Schizosaccharomyces japonicus yFS275]EEB06111.1 nuclear pore complex associated protein [Schizosaccharomyces japonicus yFS275]
MSKRPQGLRAAASLKKKCTVQNAVKGNSQEEKADDETVLVYSDDDEVSQLCGLYDMSREKLESGDIEASVSLVFGTIHEADRILRNTEKPEALPKKFHAAYSQALLAVAELYDYAKERLKDESSEEAYIDAALERAKLGEDAPGEDNVRLQLALGAGLLAKARSVLATDSSGETETASPASATATKMVQQAYNCFQALDKLEKLPEFITVFTLQRPVLAMSTYAAREPVSEQFVLDVYALTTSLLTKVAEAALTPAHKLDAQQALCTATTNVAEYYIDLADTDDAESVVTSARRKAETELSKAIDQVDALYVLNKTTDLLFRKADLKMDLANVLDGEDAQDKCLQEAADCIREAHSMGADLPEDYAEFLKAYTE